MGKQRYTKTPEEFKKFNAVLRGRFLCTNQCPYFYKCPYAKYTGVTKKEQKCKVVDMSPEEQQRFISIIVLGEEGLKDESLRILYRMGKTLNLKDDAREMKIYLEAVTGVARSFKTQKKSKEIKEMEPITIDMGLLPIEKGHSEPVIPPNPDECLIEDRESLYASPKLDGILTHPRKKVSIKGHNGNAEH